MGDSPRGVRDDSACARPGGARSATTWSLLTCCPSPPAAALGDRPASCRRRSTSTSRPCSPSIRRQFIIGRFYSPVAVARRARRSLCRATHLLGERRGRDRRSGDRRRLGLAAGRRWPRRCMDCTWFAAGSANRPRDTTCPSISRHWLACGDLTFGGTRWRRWSCLRGTGRVGLRSTDRLEKQRLRDAVTVVRFADTGPRLVADSQGGIDADATGDRRAA